MEDVKKAQINEKYEAELKIKQEEIERLTELLFGFKPQLSDAKKSLSILKEELSLAEERLQNASQEKEKF